MIIRLCITIDILMRDKYNAYLTGSIEKGPKGVVYE
jgi:hypothetical protein